MCELRPIPSSGICIFGLPYLLSGEGAQPPQPAGHPLNSPLPRAPVHSPLAFNIDMLTLGGIIRSFGSDDHIYMADTQTYLPIPADSREVLSWLITCLSALQAWVTFNFLKLNAGKTELLQIGSVHLRDVRIYDI